jgi:Flp pilus assembly protein TadD
MIQTAVNAQPKNASYLDSLGWAYFKLNRFEEAERYLSEASKLNPKNSTHQEHMGDLYARTGRLELAREEWKRALTNTTEEDVIARLSEKLNGPQKK